MPDGKEQGLGQWMDSRNDGRRKMGVSERQRWSEKIKEQGCEEK